MTDTLAAPEEEVPPLLRYTAANFIDGHRDSVRAVREDGVVEKILVDLKDPRWLLIVNGDPERGIAPLDIGSMPIEQLRAQAQTAAHELCQAADIADIEVKGRIFATSEESYRQLRVIVENATLARNMNMKHSIDYTCADGRTMHITGPEFVEVWIEIQNRNSRLAGIRQQAMNKLRLATTEREIQEIIEMVEGKIVELAGRA